MLGFSISIFPEENYIPSPKYWEREKRWSMVLATWETSVRGTDWLDSLVKGGNATLLEGSTGYPSRYRCQLSAIAGILNEGPPPHQSPQVIGDDYYLPDGWIGEIERHPDRIARCHEDAFVIIETMDLS